MSVSPPHPSRCPPTRADYAAILRAHEEAVNHAEPTYRDPSTGFVVLTVVAHLERGTCCDNGCRHCPYIES